MYSSIEKEAYKLAKIFLAIYKKYSTIHFRLKKVDKSKWWKYFIKIAKDHMQEKDWNGYTFITAQFEEYGKVFPNQLLNKEAYQTYLDYKERLERDTLKQILTSIVETFKLVKAQSKGTLDIKKFLINNRSKLLLGNINPYLFLFCKSFYEEFDYEDMESMFYDEDIDVKRAVIFKEKKVISKLRSLLKDEFT